MEVAPPLNGRARHPYYGGPDYICRYCFAVFWYGERLQSRSNSHDVVYTGCCRGGWVTLPPQSPFPMPLQQLVHFNGDSRSKRFMRLIRQYNSLFAFTSLGVDVDKLINTGNGPYVFRINGVVHHRIGSLLPPDGKRPKHAQLYIYDTHNENRLNIFSPEGDNVPDPTIVSDLISMLNEHNPLLQKFRMARDRLLSPESPDIFIKLRGVLDGHGDMYSVPTASELAALIIGSLSSEESNFDIIVETRSSQLKSVSPIHPSLMALQYPLLFPYGQPSFHTSIKLTQTDEHDGDKTHLLCISSMLLVCTIVRVNLIRLFVPHLLRCDTYQGILDAIGRGAATGRDVGVQKTLPASHIGDKHYMQ
ncbi:LOW QUALITY PROTEIN: hypothetical protein U9M48_032156 [Paspalum notatum var. saurae]|uniref:Helitron helicase-like domain-containing protein n=1 Tax=Paspalum notatum var. saurae TaxID=547442 RepID=A0AAQ3X536_PASNO